MANVNPNYGGRRRHAQVLIIFIHDPRDAPDLSYHLRCKFVVSIGGAYRPAFGALDRDAELHRCYFFEVVVGPGQPGLSVVGEDDEGEVDWVISLQVL